MSSLSDLVAAQPSRRLWVSTLASLLIVAAFAAFYMQRYHETRTETAARSLRLLATGAEAVRKAADGGARLIVGHPECMAGIRVEPPAAAKTQVQGSGDEPSATESKVPCLPFDKVLSYVPKGTTLFDKLMLVKNGEEVLARLGSSSSPNLLSLHELRVLDSSGKKLTDHAEQPNFGSSALVESGAERLQLACQPLTSPVIQYDPNAPNASSVNNKVEVPVAIHVCGMVTEARLVREAVAVSPVLLVLFSMLLVCALLVPPFLKTALLSFTERLHFVDVVMVGLCVFAWLMLATVVGLNLFTYVTLRAQSSERLEKLGVDVATKVRIEVEEWRRVLGGMNAADYLQNVRNPRCPRPCEQIEAIALANADGDQVARWKVTRNALVRTPPVDVSSRRYFNQALERGGVVVDSVKTFTSGDTRAIFAKRVEMSGAPLVLTMSVRLNALKRDDLPSSVSFALVDSDGSVAFHSDSALSNSHNLFDETDQNEQLRQLVADPKARDSVDGLSYWGISYQAYVTSSKARLCKDEDRAKKNPQTKLLKDADATPPTPWAVVTFVEAEPIRRIVFLSGTRALAWCGVYLLGCSLLFGLFVSAGRKNLAWAWPSAQRAREYRKLGWVYAALGLAPIVGAVLLPLAGCVAALLLPLLLVIATSLIYTVPHGAEWRRRAPSIDHLVIFQLSSGVFWFVVTAVPALAIAFWTTTATLSGAGDAIWGTSLPAPYDAILGVPGPVAWSRLPAPRVSGIGILAGTLLTDVVLTITVVFWGLRTVFLGGVLGAASKTWRAIARQDAQQAPQVWCVVASRAELERAPSSWSERIYLESAADLWAALPPAGTAGGVPRLIVSPRTPRQILQLIRETLSDAAFAVCAARLAHFKTVFIQDGGPGHDEDGSKRAPSLARRLLGSVQDGACWWKNRRYKWLCRELDVSQHVYEACARNIPVGSLGGLDGHELKRAVRDACWQYYLGIWQACSSLERLTLLQLSQEAFINQKRIDVVRDLLSRGILRRRPMLAPMTDSFGLFVCAMGEQEELTSLETSTHRLSWDTLKIPLFTLLVCSAAAFFYTQRALFDTTLVFATTMTSLLPQIGRWVALLGVAPVRVASAAPSAQALV